MRYLSTYRLFEYESKSMINKMGLLQDLSVDLSDEGLYIEITTDDVRFQRRRGIEYIYLRIEDKDRVFCKSYPKDGHPSTSATEMDEMDWLNTKPIITDFIKKMEDFGMKRDVDYKLYGGGVSVTFVFEGKTQLDSIKL